MKTIPIFFSFDNNYVIPAAVAFFSLLNKAKKNTFYKMYVLHSDITEQNKKLLKEIINNKKEKATLSFINTFNFLKEEWKTGNWANHNYNNQFTVNTIVKCFASRFFVQYNKIIYSDVDVIFVDDISEIFDIDISNNYIAAVKSFLLKIKGGRDELIHLNQYYEKLKETYFAGGIWVLNLEKIRNDNLEKKMLDIINDNTITKRFPDQEIMNIACENKISYLPLNYISYPYLYGVIEKHENFQFLFSKEELIGPMKSHYSRDELYDSLINPKIIHFAATKPWKTMDIPYSTLWWTYFSYLRLPKSSIFSPGINGNFLETINANNKKYKNTLSKYKITIMVLFTIFFIIIFYLIFNK